MNWNCTGIIVTNHHSSIAAEDSTPAGRVVNLGGGWKLADPLEFTVRVTNLTDEKYEALPVYASRGRAFHAGLRGRFQQ